MLKDSKIALIIGSVGLAIFCYLWYRGKIPGLPPFPLKPQPTEGELTEAERAEAMQEAMYAWGAIAPRQEVALAEAAAQRTPEEQALVEKVAIARYKATKKAAAAGKTTKEIEWAGRVAGAAALQGISEAEAAERFKAIWAREGYLAPAI